MDTRGVFKRVGPYELSSTLGQGSFAMVYRGQHRVSKRIVAVKAIVRARLNQKLQQNLEAEISILQTLQHPNIVRLHDVQTTERHVYLIMELCPGGDLMRVIRAHGPQSEAQTRVYLRQLVHGLRYLRENNLVHRDLKPQNLLLSSTQPDAVLKIADFGFARYMQQADMAETLCGSPLYMAPEILRFHKYDAKADLWSVGTIIYELLTARPPFTGANHVQLLKQIEEREVELPTRLSPACCNLLTSLLRREPTARLSFEHFFAHPFLEQDAGAEAPSPAVRAASSSATESEAERPTSQGAASPHPPHHDSVAAPPPTLPQRATAEHQPSPAPLRLPDSVAGSSASTGATLGGAPGPLPHGAREQADREPSPMPLPAPVDGPFASISHSLPTPRKLRSPTAALLATSPLAAPQVSPLLPSSIPELVLPMSPIALAPTPLSNCLGRPGQIVALPLLTQGQLVATTRRQVVPVAVAGSSHSTLTAAYLVPGLGVSGTAHAFPTLTVYDKSLDGLDNEYVLVSQPGNARTNGLLEQRDWRGAGAGVLATTEAGQRGVLPLQRALKDEPPRQGALAAHAQASDGGAPQVEQALLPELRQATHQQAERDEQQQRQQQHRQQLLAGRAFAVAELAQQSADGGLAPHGETFTMAESLALHVKALDLTQQALQLAQAQGAIAMVGALQPAYSHAEVLRERFATLLESAEWIREQLRCEQSLSGTTTVCVEELLYGHALAMGREAAIDEMVGKLHTSRALYQRAKLLLEQLAEEPHVGHADRAVLSKYAAGFAWRLQEIAMTENSDEPPVPRRAC